MLKKGSSRKGERRRKSVNAHQLAENSAATSSVQKKAAHKSVVVLKEIRAGAVALPVAELGIADPYRGKAAGFRPPAEQSYAPHQGVETQWGGTYSKRKSSRWIWIGVGTVAVLFFSALSVFTYANMKENHNPQDRMSGFVVETEEFDPSSPLFVYQQDPQRYLMECLTVLQKFADARDVADVIPLVRHQPETLVALKTRWQPWPSPPKIQSEMDYDYTLAESGGIGYITIHGVNNNNTPFDVYFTHENGAMLLDWAASTGLGDSRLSTVVRNPPTHPVSMRVILSSSPYYLPALPEDEYESYKLTCPDDEAVIWGYVKRGSEAHRKIAALLHTNGELLESLAEARAIVKIKKTEDLSAKNRFFITEMLHNDWVMP
jgi:hypothetical protein